MTLEEFDTYIAEAYLNRNRNVLEAASMLHVEAAELSELFLKEKWYNKKFTNNDLLSEAGDILNFLTYILATQDLSLEDAMENNITKLKERNWL